jgi:hypothetical protein
MYCSVVLICDDRRMSNYEKGKAQVVSAMAVDWERKPVAGSLV